MLQISVPQVLGDYCFSAKHDHGTQPDVALPSLDIGQCIPHGGQPVAARGHSRGPLSSGRPGSSDTERHYESDTYPSHIILGGA